MNNNKWYKVVFESLSEKKGIPYYVDQLHSNFHVSILVLDISGKIVASAIAEELKIAQNREYKIGDSILLSDLEQKRKVDQIGNQTILEDQGIYIINEPIRKKNTVIGYTVMFFYQREKAVEFMLPNKILAQAIEVEWNKNLPFIYYGKTIQDQLYARMILQDEKRLDPLIEKEVPAGYCLCIFADLEINELQEIYKQVQKSSKKNLTWVDGKRMYVLFWEIKEHMESSVVREMKMIAKGNCRLAISEYFSSLQICSAKKDILKRMLMIGEGNILLEKEYYTQVIYSFASDVLGKDIYKNFQMYRLKEEERNTLKVYLNFGNQLKKTAAFLHIHRNTLVYRLMKIQEILQCDLNEVKTQHELLAELMIYDSYKQNILRQEED